MFEEYKWKNSRTAKINSVESERRSAHVRIITIAAYVLQMKYNNNVCAPPTWPSAVYNDYLFSHVEKIYVFRRSIVRDIFSYWTKSVSCWFFFWPVYRGGGTFRSVENCLDYFISANSTNNSASFMKFTLVNLHLWNVIHL